MKLTVTSAYLPYDSDKPPPTELGTSSTTEAQKQNAAHLDCNCNGHNITWGSTGNHPQRACLMQCLVRTKFNILKRGKKPNSAYSNRREVTDLTMGNDKKEDLLTRWNASDQIHFSDHIYISQSLSHPD